MKHAVSTPIEQNKPIPRGNGGILSTLTVPVVLLTVIVLICFWKTLGSFFLADDFSQVAYASKIVDGNVGMLLANFTGSYMQNPIMKIYRPCLLLSLVYDYALWHTNAFGYFLTDILLLTGSAFMLFLLLRQLTTAWPTKHSVIFSLSSAALFASNPLHCESISFVSGRDNVICAFFCLLSLWCFAKNGLGKSRKLMVMGIASFWIAMLSKEIGIGLPATLAALIFFQPDLFMPSDDGAGDTSQLESGCSIKKRTWLAARTSLPIWASAVLYLTIRLLVLGTMAGGYVGGSGAGLMMHLFERWTNPHTIFAIMCPLNGSIFTPNSRFKTELVLIYLVLIMVASFRILTSSGSVRTILSWSAILTIWALTTIVPLYQLWGLGPNLEGARFLFFLTIPLSIFLPLLIYVPQSDEVKSNSIRSSILAALGSTALIALIVWNISVTVKNNTPWVHAGNQTRACMEQAQALAGSISEGKKVLVIGLPKEEGGAYMISNCATFDAMVSPPFSKSSFGDRFETFDPIFYGRPEFINAQRFGSLLLDPRVTGGWLWREKALKFERLQTPTAHSFSVTTTPLTISAAFPGRDVQVLPYTAGRGMWNIRSNRIGIDGDRDGSGLIISKIKIDPFVYDFLELELSERTDIGGSDKGAPILVFWKGQKSEPGEWSDVKHPVKAELLSSSGSKLQVLRARLSDHWRWFSQGEISCVRVELPPNKSLELRGVHLMPGKVLMPKISVLDVRPTGAGVYPVGKEGFRMIVDGTAVEGSASIRLEITKPNYFFADCSDDPSQCILFTISTAGHEEVKLSGAQLAIPAYYELRASCLNKEGKPVGEPSDPITIQRY